MFLNNRQPPKALLYYNALSLRSPLSSEENYAFITLQKGYEGECLYDKILDDSGHENIYVLRDLYLPMGKTVAQYDSIIVTGDHVAVNEIKIFLEIIALKMATGIKRIVVPDNAFAQLSRAKSRLKKMRNDCQLDFEVAGNLIFPNDDFRLATENNYVLKEAVLRNQMRKYFREMNETVRSDKALHIAQEILQRAVENPYFTETADLFNIRRDCIADTVKALI